MRINRRSPQTSSSVSVQRSFVCRPDSCPNVAAGATERFNATVGLCPPLFRPPPTGYRSPLNDFQRSEGRELVPTSWNSARVLLLPGLTLEDCATRCAQSLDCRYPAFSCFNRTGCRSQEGPWLLLLVLRLNSRAYKSIT